MGLALRHRCAHSLLVSVTQLLHFSGEIRPIVLPGSGPETATSRSFQEIKKSVSVNPLAFYYNTITRRFHVVFLQELVLLFSPCLEAKPRDDLFRVGSLPSCRCLLAGVRTAKNQMVCTIVSSALTLSVTLFVDVSPDVGRDVPLQHRHVRHSA